MLALINIHFKHSRIQILILILLKYHIIITNKLEMKFYQFYIYIY